MDTGLRNRIRQYFRYHLHCRELLNLSESERNDLAISRVDAEQLAGRFQTPGCHKLYRGERTDV